MNELITSTSSLTTAVKNVYDITVSMISLRKQNRLISAGQLQLLKNAVQQAVEEDRITGMHYLMTHSRGLLVDSFNQVNVYANTDFGLILLESLKKEYFYFMKYCEDYDRLTRPGGFR